MYASISSSPRDSLPGPLGICSIYLNTLACIPGVSHRVIAQKVRAGAKKKRHSYFVLLSSQLSRQNRAETLAMLARNTWAEKL